MIQNVKRFLVVFLVFIFLTGCNSYTEVTNEKTNLEDGQAIETENNHEKDNDLKNHDKVENEQSKEQNKEKEEKDLKSTIDLSVKPNEAGKIMILMYHNIGSKESDWVRTPENFRKDLKTLYEKGYRAISLKDFVNNNIDVEAGCTPVVITFDDGNRNNFNIISKDGEKTIDPNCAVGIMEQFNKQYPDFSATATFFLNGTNPFRQSKLLEYKLNYLIDNGFHIGNHTYGHENLTKLGPTEIQEAIGKNAIYLENIVKDYKINTLALPYGSRPRKEYYKYLEKGQYKGKRYENIAILNVGSNPAYSPIDKRFNPASLPRVRASEMNVQGLGLYDWLEYFDNNPEERFISDGNANIITVPKKFEDRIDNEKVDEKELYIY
ncbi:polysaccharide deacetylase family protein [Caldisalinibacter kiritimatiensis]|uniref:Polysaccharide deacetylase n=1 Tax=Caldisalinibacter kiritimatiensis TaxID=1304284 RepID=R1AQV9_9FIRM|nr:polysaccharide deacetylase family protein [Caldisalinibacter kiritimatiensis]EOC99502.1 Polysaccharide deacetylase [Caldisalinibacter kiritimatiensis]